MRRDAETGATAVVVVGLGALRRAAWEALLAEQPGLEVAGSAPAPAEMARIRPLSGRVAVLVDGMGQRVSQASELVAAARGAGVLWLLEEIEIPTVVTLLRAGVMGCLPFEASSAQLARAVIAVGGGEIALPPSVAAPALAALARPAPAGHRAIEELTERERQVVALLVQGSTNKEIAQAMFLSVRTVEAHLRSIYAKFDVQTRTQAVLWAIAHKDDEV